MLQRHGVGNLPPACVDSRRRQREPAVTCLLSTAAPISRLWPAPQLRSGSRLLQHLAQQLPSWGHGCSRSGIPLDLELELLAVGVAQGVHVGLHGLQPK